MMTKGKKVLLYTIATLIIILVGVLANYYLEEDKPNSDAPIVDNSAAK